MKRKGLVWQAKRVAAGFASVGMLGALVGTAAPLAAAQESDGATWTMPAVEEEILQDAVDAVYEAAGSEDIDFQFSFRGMTEVVYNYANWEVCSQYPAEDDDVEMTSKVSTVYLQLARPGKC